MAHLFFEVTMSGSQVNLYTTLVELIRFDKNYGVNRIHSHTIENNLAINGEKTEVTGKS